MFGSFRGTALLLAGGLIGFAAGSIRTLGAAPRQPPPQARVVVGLKQPWSPSLHATLRKVFKAQLVTIAPEGAYVLVLLKQGQSLAEVQAMSPLVAWVEPEVVMALPEPVARLPIVIPAPRRQARQ